MNFKDATNTLLATVSLESLCDKLSIETKRSGNSIKAICQFHADTKPSMELYDTSEGGGSKYHCFSCGAHGDIFALVKENKGMSFIEAHTWLAQEYNVTVTRSASKGRNKGITTYDKITTNAFEYALEFFKNTQDTNKLGSYLAKRRYDMDFAGKADLCIVGQCSLVTHLDSLEYPENTHKLSVFDLYESAGLIKRDTNSRNEAHKTRHLPLENLYYDHFRNNRLLFPIRTSEGELKGFSGRLTGDNNRGPKYLFTKNLNKSSLLYRSEIAFKNIRRDKKKTVKLFVCEGFFDALRLERLGLHAVSILGANLSENQCKSICDLALQLGRGGKLLEVNLFLDNDPAGVRATASAIKKLFKMSNPGDFEIKIIHSTVDKKVDPDSLLKDVLNNKEAKLKIAEAEFPLPALYLADQLNISTKEAQDNDFFKDLPYALKIRATKEWYKLFDEAQIDFSLDNYAKEYAQKEWLKFMLGANSIQSSKNIHSDGNFITQQSPRLQLAFSIAKSSMARTGTFPANDAEWRRVEMCFSVLEMILIDRFNALKNDFKPIEPLNTIYVSRDIGGDEYREMSQHCLEDLTSHQYILSELLTERHDHINNFSLHIPATRYYSKSKLTITTGEGEGEHYGVTLSFAYQIDMEVVEGRDVPRTSGMFRPYFDCWKEFTKSINHAASKMSQVHMVRLDLKRYYDRLKRHIVQNALRDCLPKDLDAYLDDDFMALFGNKDKNQIIDWLLDQSFGYKKYNPQTGDPEESDYFQGIPQGPDLSSFLANLVLFKVDHAARLFLEDRKDSTGYYPAWYARYVDDMVLLAEDATLLAQLRVVVEDTVNKLELELIAKEQPMPMSTAEFELYLTQGKALASSGPDGNIELVNIDDIEFIEKIERYEALGLLNNKQLYSDDVATIKLKINMAAHGKQLRFSDIKKLTKWIWFAVIEQSKSSDIAIPQLIKDYKYLWDEVTSNLNQKLNPVKCPWEDPLLLALDGLDQLIERNSWIDDQLDESQLKTKLDTRVNLINLINKKGLIEKLCGRGTTNIDGWGTSKIELARTYWQKRTNLCWHARQYHFDNNSGDEIEFLAFNMNHQLGNNNELKKSLLRTQITELICEKKVDIEKNEMELKPENLLFELCILLQTMYLKFSHSSNFIPSETDVLSQISGEIKSLALSLSGNEQSETIKLFNLFLSDQDKDQRLEPDNKLVIKALHFICNVTSDSSLINVLSSRWDGLINESIEGDNYRLITPLPTIDEKTIYGCSINASGETEISGLMRLSIAPSEDDIINNNDIFVSSESTPTRTDWQDKPSNSEDKVLIQTANSESLKSAKNIFLTPPNLIGDIDADILQWAASSYRAILKCNDGGSRIPTWSNLAMKVLPSHSGDSVDNQVSILSFPNTDNSYPQAFIRNGGMGLRPLQIPLHNSEYWQAGIALTDIMGFTRELDQYANVDEETGKGAETPQTRLLKNSLKKLNGSIYFSRPVVSGAENQLPKTIERTLNLLENYPESGDSLESYTYVLISEMETQLMRLRLDSKISLTIGGGLSQLYGNAVKATLNRIPLEWFTHLLKGNHEKINTKDRILRSSCHFWLSLYQVFKSTFLKANLKSENKHIERIQSTILLGCQFNLIEAWLKAIVFESEATAPMPLNQYQNIDIVEQLSDLPLKSGGLIESELPLDIEMLIFRQNTEDNSVEDLGNYYLSLLKDKATQNSFNEILPLGWFVLALVKKKVLLSENKNISIPTELIKRLFDSPILFNLLSFKYEIADDEDGEVWPLEHTHREVEIEGIISQLNTLDSITACDILENTSPNVVKAIINKHFSYDQLKCNFQNNWFIRKWQIDIAASTANDSKPYYNNVDNELLSSWTETYCDNKPIYISSCGNLYGKILKLITDNSTEIPIVANEVIKEEILEKKVSNADSSKKVDSGIEQVNDDSSEKVLVDTEQVDGDSSEKVLIDTEQVDSDSSEKVLIDSEQLDVDSSEKVLIDSEQVDDKKATDATLEQSENINNKFSDIPFGDGVWKQLDDIQKKMHNKAWRLRKNNKSPSHIRAALLQLELKTKFGQGYDLPTSNTLKHDEDEYKYEEMRRQAILTQALNSCEGLGVELLVLPEYSVQPETILWLKKFLINKEISVLAGTYRLPNKYSKDKVSKLTNRDYAETVKPFQAVMSLLVPYDGDVICLNRAKKYASAAADELIYPHQSEIKPLFTINDFEQQVLRPIETLEDKLKKELDLLQQETKFTAEINKIRRLIAGYKPSFSIEKIQEIFSKKHIKPLNYLQELICAELFLLSSSTNYLNLASEFKSLSHQFGITDTSGIEEAIAKVLADIKFIAANLSGISQDSNFQPYRRSIVAIPAMTSRKQDYWIFGQGAMLANGCSTIFCNSVYGAYSTGGSCFIGLDSWLGEKKKEFITPYNGWSKGIYYCHKEDTLEKEQSLLVVDIDPSMMNLGSPRPQTLPVPMKLVAHIPIIEIPKMVIENISLIKDESCSKTFIKNKNYRKNILLAETYKVALESFQALEKNFTPADIINPNTDDIKKIKTEFLHMFEHHENNYDGFSKRVEYWGENWDKHCQTGMPALTDWVGVQIPTKELWELENKSKDNV